MSQRICADCKKPITGDGFESATKKPIEGTPEQQWVNRELCEGCFKIDYKKKFPTTAPGS